MKLSQELSSFSKKDNKENLTQLKRVAKALLEQKYERSLNSDENSNLERAIDQGQKLNDIIDALKLFPEETEDDIKCKLLTLILGEMIQDQNCALSLEAVHKHMKQQGLMTYEVILLYGYHALLPDLDKLGCNKDSDRRLKEAKYPPKEIILKAWTQGQGIHFLKTYQSIDRLVKMGLGSPEEVKAVLENDSDPEKFLKTCKEMNQRGLTKLDMAILNNKKRLANALAHLQEDLSLDTLLEMMDQSRKRLTAVHFMTDVSDAKIVLASFLKEESSTKIEDALGLSKLTSSDKVKLEKPSTSPKSIPKFAETEMGYLAMSGDGNCQFHTCLEGIKIAYKDVPAHPIHNMNHLDLRRAVADYIDQHWADEDKNWGMFISLHFEECIHRNEMVGIPEPLKVYLNYFAYSYRFAQFMDPEGIYGLKLTVDTAIEAFFAPENHGAIVGMYTEALRQPKTWGNDQELAALSAMFGVQFVKHQVNHFRKPVAPPFPMGGSGPQIHLAYNGGHYDLLLTPEQALQENYQIGFNRQTSLDLSSLVFSTMSDRKPEPEVDDTQKKRSNSPSQSSEEAPEFAVVQSESQEKGGVQTGEFSAVASASKSEEEVRSTTPPLFDLGASSEHDKSEPTTPPQVKETVVSVPVDGPEEKQGSLVQDAPVSFVDDSSLPLDPETRTSSPMSVDDDEKLNIPMPMDIESDGESVDKELSDNNPFAFQAHTLTGFEEGNNPFQPVSKELCFDWKSPASSASHSQPKSALLSSQGSLANAEKEQELFGTILSLLEIEDSELQAEAIEQLSDKHLSEEVMVLAITKRYQPDLTGDVLNNAIQDVIRGHRETLEASSRYKF